MPLEGTKKYVLHACQFELWKETSSKSDVFFLEENLSRGGGGGLNRVLH